MNPEKITREQEPSGQESKDQKISAIVELIQTKDNQLTKLKNDSSFPAAVKARLMEDLQLEINALAEEKNKILSEKYDIPQQDTKNETLEDDPFSAALRSTGEMREADRLDAARKRALG